MKRFCSPFFLSIALAGLMLAGCGGGGGNVNNGGMMGSGLTATFTPDVAAPVAGSISMAAGAATGDTFQVEIRVTDVVDFFGTAFSLRFDPATATYQSFDVSTSLLQAFAPDIEIRADLDLVDAGLIAVVASLKNPITGPIQGIDTSMIANDVLLTLTFRATNPTVGPNHNPFSVDAVRMREVRTCPTPPAACSALGGVNWNGGTLTAL